MLIDINRLLKVTSVLVLVTILMISPAMSLSQLVINTWPLPNATAAAYKALERGSLLDAIVDGCTNAEEDRKMTSVGWGGSPAENGETALDALIIDGVSHNMGAVGSMKRIKNAIRVARHVLENTKHTLLVGEDATKFAVEMGFIEEDLTSQESKEQWENWKAGKCQPNFWQNVIPDSTISCGPYQPKPFQFATKDTDREGLITEDNHDTIGMIAINSHGDIAAGTSTNGATFKITGRVGDSPIPGSGAYVDNEFGAAAATGDGDVMMRFLPSYQTVENMRSGMPPSEAAEHALRRIIKYYPHFEGALVAANKTGSFGAACYGWTFQYSVMTPQMDKPEIVTVKPFEL